MKKYRPHKLPAKHRFYYLAVDAVDILRTFIHGGKGNL